MTDKGIIRFHYMSRFFSYVVTWNWKFLVVLWRGGAPLASRTAQMPIRMEAGGCHGRRTPLGCTAHMSGREMRGQCAGTSGIICGPNKLGWMGTPERANNTLESGGISSSTLANSCFSGGWQGAEEGNWDGCGSDPWQVRGAFTLYYNLTLSLPACLSVCSSYYHLNMMLHWIPSMFLINKKL